MEFTIKRTAFWVVVWALAIWVYCEIGLIALDSAGL